MKIDKNIPLPPHKSKYPFRSMEVGDSFFSTASRSSIGSSASKLKGIKFSTRTVNEDGVRGTRVWRVL